MMRIIKILAKHTLMSLVVAVISLSLVLISVYGITKTVSATSFKNDIPEVKNLQDNQVSSLSITATPTPAPVTPTQAPADSNNSPATNKNTGDKKEDVKTQTSVQNRRIEIDDDVENVHEDVDRKAPEKKEVESRR